MSLDVNNSQKIQLQTIQVPKIRVYVPRDSTALSIGANRTAKAITLEAQKRGIEI